jgi:hypothetical protein
LKSAERRDKNEEKIIEGKEQSNLRRRGTKE